MSSGIRLATLVGMRVVLDGRRGRIVKQVSESDWRKCKLVWVKFADADVPEIRRTRDLFSNEKEQPK
jgi:hypothetical protein